MIEFGAPWGFLALLAVPLIIVLHSLRPRRVDTMISSVWIWREALRERRRGFGLQRLSQDLSLMVWLLIALILSVSLADPHWLSERSTREETVLLLDSSASMQAKAGRVSRFDLAKSRALEFVDQLPENARMLVMTVGAKPALRSAFESKRSTLRHVIEQLEPSDEAGRPADGLNLAASVLREPSRGRVIFLTDAAFDDTEALRRSLASGRIVTEVMPPDPLARGSSAGNVAITRFDFRPELATEERFQVLVRLRNFSAVHRAVPLAITVEGQTVFQRTVSLPGGAAETLVLPLVGRVLGRARAELMVEDDLAADNVAFAVVASDEPLRVLIFGDQNVFLESALGALPNVYITRVDEFRSDRFAEQVKQHDVVIFDRIPPPEFSTLPEDARLVLIDTVAPGLPFRARGWVDQPVISGRGASALVANIDLAGIKIERARRVGWSANGPAAQAPAVQRLFWSNETDLALAYVNQSRRLIYIGFDLSGSSFPLLASFPLFLQESLNWLRPRASRYGKTQTCAGEPVVLAVRRPPAQIVVHTPSARFERTVSTPSYRFEETARAGIYRYVLGGVEQYFAVNLTDERESNIRARAMLGQPSPKAHPDGASIQGARSAGGDADGSTRGNVAIPLWPFLVGCAGLGLVLEAAWGWRVARA